MLKFLDGKVKLKKRTKDFLNVLPKKAKVAEIGVHLADYSEVIYQLCEPLELHLIDAWDYIPINPPALYFDIPGRYEVAKSKFQKNERVFFHKKYSDEAVLLFENEYFDWVYIDADHHYEFIKKDLEMWSKKVKKGGYICGHDYSYKCPGVLQAVSEFVKLNNLKIDYITTDDVYPSWAIKKL